jgi:PAS domain S-box-containing protein
MVGLSFEAVARVATAVWPPTGIALMALVLGGYRLWPGIAVGAFLVNCWAGAPVPVAGGIALGNTLEALVGTVLLQRVGFRPTLDRLRDVVGLVVLAAVLSTLLSATIGVTSGWLGGLIAAATLGPAWRTWWLGDAMGDLVMAPLLFVWSGRGRLARPWAWGAEAVAVCAVSGALSCGVFGGVQGLTGFPYLVFPVLIWAAVRLGPQGAMTALALVAAIAVWGTIRGASPFAGQTLQESLLLLQAFLSVVAVTTLVLAAVVAERRQAEEARTHLAAIVESSEDAILSTTLDGRITSWNQGAERLYGYTAAEIVGQPLTRLIPPDLTNDLVQMLARLQRGDRLEQYETQRVAKDGTRLAVALTLSPLRDGAGQMRGASTIARDITARKQAEAELERRRQETALLAELAQQLSASLDLDTVLQHVVTGAQTLCGSERVFLALRDPGTDTFIGRYEIGEPHMAYTGFRIVPGQGLGGQVLRTGQPGRTADYAADPRFSKEYLARARAEGHLAVLAVPILMAARVEGLLYASNPARQPFTDQDEAILVRLASHAALAMQNAHLYRQAQAELAERRTAEAALVRAAAELEQRVAERTAALHQEMAERQRLEQEAQRVQHFALLGRLAAGVSHEIRNPLGAIFLHVDLLAEELGEHAPESAALVADTLADIRTQLARLEDLVQDYLSLVRAAQIERTPQDLGAALRAWATEWQTLATAHGITCQVDGLDDVGVVAVHANTLRRALLNLVQNALDAMPQGGTLTLQGRRADATVRLDVGDTGSGIPPDQRARIFEPLYTTKAGGTGLGLYIVQEVVTAHGGQVAVQSVVGQGSTFTITLPLRDSSEAP